MSTRCQHWDVAYPQIVNSITLINTTFTSSSHSRSQIHTQSGCACTLVGKVVSRRVDKKKLWCRSVPHTHADPIRGYMLSAKVPVRQRKSESCPTKVRTLGKWSFSFYAKIKSEWNMIRRGHLVNHFGWERGVR